MAFADTLEGLGRGVREYNYERPLRDLYALGEGIQGLNQRAYETVAPFGRGLLGSDSRPSLPALGAPQKPGQVPPPSGQPAQVQQREPEQYASRAGELDKLEELYNRDPEAYYRGQKVAVDESGTLEEHPQARRSRLAAEGFTEYAPGVHYKGPALKGGGSVSFGATAPENVNHATFASQLEDAQEAGTLAELRQKAADPYGLRKQAAIAEIQGAHAGDKENAKIGSILATLQDGEDRVAAQEAQRLHAIQTDPRFQGASPEDRAKMEAEIKKDADAQRERLRQSVGLATGQGAGLFKTGLPSLTD